MVLTEKQLQLFDFVEKKHKDQKRKYTGDPYTVHLLSVAEIVSKHEDDSIEIALCHDLFEDTDCDFDMLYKEMIVIGYEPFFSYAVCTCVKELTDVFTPENYPYLNRGKRKLEEAKRLGKISSLSKSVKYADLLDNTASITKHDPVFAEIYLKEKRQIMELMIGGNSELYSLCKTELQKASQLI